jgi:hypothetical protein
MINKNFYENQIAITGDKIEKLNYWDRDPIAQNLNLYYKKHLVLSLYKLHGEYARAYPYTSIN